MDELISVIVPVFNIEDYLENCIRSILRQTYTNLEIIAVDDGSTDASLSVLKKLEAEESRLHVLHQDIGGGSSARLAGLSQAKGTWIGFVDGDDEIEPDMFERLLKNALQYHTDISHCGYQMVFPSRVDYYYNTGKLLVQNRRDALIGLLDGSFEPGLCNKLVHRSLIVRFLNSDRFDGSIRINEDLLMNYYLFRSADRSVFEDFCPYHYQLRKGSAATSFLKPYKLRDPIRVRQILEAETRDDPELHGICLTILAQCLIRTSTMSSRGFSPEIDDCIHEAREQLKSLLPALRTEKHCSNRARVLASWASASPGTYRMIHSLYSELSGKAHKYDVKSQIDQRDRPGL